MYLPPARHAVDSLVSNEEVSASESAYDRELGDHGLQNHRDQIKASSESQDGDLWDVYKQAIDVKEREKMPTVGPAKDGMSINHTLVTCDDKRLKALICFA